ncbi:unnamed protein product [Brassica rapa subsp. trilocularis]
MHCVWRGIGHNGSSAGTLGNNGGPLFVAVFNPLLLVIHNEMKKKLNGLVPLEENEVQKSVRTIVVSGNNSSGSIEMKMMENSTSGRKEVAMASCH